MAIELQNSRNLHHTPIEDQTLNDQYVVLFTSFIQFYSQHFNLDFFLSQIQMTEHFFDLSFIINLNYQ